MIRLERTLLRPHKISGLCSKELNAICISKWSQVFMDEFKEILFKIIQQNTQSIK